MGDVFKKYRKASMDYAASKKPQQLTDRTKDNKDGNLNEMKWEPAKFDVTTTANLDSPQVIVKDDVNAIDSSIALSEKQKDSDLFSTKKFLSFGKKMVTKTMNITSDLISGNSPKPSPPAPLPPIDMTPNNEDDDNENDDDDVVDEDELKEEAKDTFVASASLES